MKYVDEYRDVKAVNLLARQISELVTHPWSIMEICGGQTHTIMKYGIEELLPKEITLLHGPGCPVCVTPLEQIDKAITIASRSDVIFTSFGDMLRVPGSEKDLLTVKANGGDVRIVYSPLDAIKIAEENKGKKVIFFSVGFETTAPVSAISVIEADRRGLKNFSILCSHVLVPPAIEALLSSDECFINGILAAGHVCTVMGYEQYIPLSQKYRTPIIVTGFEPVDILQGILMCVKQLEEGRFETENQYGRVVSKKGNVAAQNILENVFKAVDRKWRGIGTIPRSGFALKEEYAEFDAERIFNIEHYRQNESPLCIAGKILKGVTKPNVCRAFGNECKPETPLGAPMVSSEGACAAYFHYARNN
jgi:hydrogenase expression/formation protein HypD